jgi:hypothetical protein
MASSSKGIQLLICWISRLHMYEKNVGSFQENLHEPMDKLFKQNPGCPGHELLTEMLSQLPMQTALLTNSPSHYGLDYVASTRAGEIMIGGGGRVPVRHISGLCKRAHPRREKVADIHVTQSKKSKLLWPSVKFPLS